MRFEVRNDNPRISFDEQVNRWDRYLLIDGQRAYQISGGCGTCHFLFEKLSHANRTFSASILNERFEKSENVLDEKFLKQVSSIF